MTLKRIFRVILSMTPEVYPEKSRMFMDLNSYDTFFWKLKIMVILKKEENDKFDNYEENSQKH
jgi:hypothetical protein